MVQLLFKLVGMDKLVSTIADLSAAMAAHTAALDGLTTAVNDAVAKLGSLGSGGGTTLSAADQATLDSVVSSLSTATSSVTGESSELESAVTPPAPPATTTP